MSPASRIERVVQHLCLVAWVSFLVVGVLFFAAPDAVLARLAELGARVGEFSPLPPSGAGFWICLSSAYMAVVTALAFSVWWDPRTHAGLLPLLALGKATSSLTTLVLWYRDRPAFVYLLNFATDGSIALAALGAWAALAWDAFAAGRDPFPGSVDPWESRELRRAGAALLEALLPARAEYGREGRPEVALQAFLEFVDGLHPVGRRALAWTVTLLEWSPLVLPLHLTRLSRLDRETRRACLASWTGSRFLWRRALVGNLRFLVYTVFYGGQAVAGSVGYRGVEPLGPAPAAAGGR